MQGDQVPLSIGPGRGPKALVGKLDEVIRQVAPWFVPAGCTIAERGLSCEGFLPCPLFCWHALSRKSWSHRFSHGSGSSLPSMVGKSILAKRRTLAPSPPMRIQNRKGPYYIVMKLHTITKNVIVVSPYYNVNGTMCILFYQHMHTNIPLFGNYIKNVVNYQQCKM
jgi:hypothetical protein